MRVVVLALLLLLFPAAAAPVAQAEAAGPTRADVILLLDRSGSMVKNDPADLAATGARVFAGMLDSADRVAVVAFDSGARTVLPLSPVGDGQAVMAALGSMGPPRGQWTDVKAGLEAALQSLGQADPQRQPAVLLFTDGKPETQPGGVPDGYLAQLDELVSRAAGRQIPVFTVGLGQADFGLLGRMATGTRAESFAATGPEQVVELFSGVLSRIKERHVVLSYQEDLAPGVAGQVRSFQVPPYTRLLTLHGVGAGGAGAGGVTLKGQMPGGGALAEAPGLKASSGANYTVYTIPNPAPGAWTVQLEGAGRVEAQAQTESALRLSLLEPQPYSQVAATGATPVSVAVDGDPDPESPLEVWAQAGAGQPVQLKGGADGRYAGELAMGDGRLAVWAARAGAQVARREFRLYPVASAGLDATAGGEIGAPAAGARRWIPGLIALGVLAALALVGGAVNWRRIRKRDEALSGSLGHHSLKGRGRELRIGDIALLEARLWPGIWPPLAGLGLGRRELHIFIRPLSGVRLQVNGRPPGDGRLYHGDEVTLGGETHTLNCPRLGRRPVGRGHRPRPPVKKGAGRTLKG